MGNRFERNIRWGVCRERFETINSKTRDVSLIKKYFNVLYKTRDFSTLVEKVEGRYSLFYTIQKDTDRVKSIILLEVKLSATTFTILY